MESKLVGSFVKQSTLSSLPFPVADSSSFSSGSRIARFQQLNITKKSFIGGVQQRPLLHPIKCLDEKFPLYQKLNKKYAVNAAFEKNIEFTGADQPKSPLKSIQDSVDLFFKFLRPYATVAEVLNVAAICFMTVEKFSDLTPLFYARLLQALVATFLMQVHVSGTNQVCDIEIDRVNKPYLVLASGELSIPDAIKIIAVSTLLSFSVAWIGGSWPLFWTLVAWFAIGFGYSVPVPFSRWKANSFTAALSMIVKSVLVIPIGFSLHMGSSLFEGSAALAKTRIFALGMIFIYYLVIMLFKDIPDMEGDQKQNIQTLVSRIGPDRMYWGSIWVLEMAFGAAILVGASSSFLWSKCITVLGHGIMALILWMRAKSVDVKDKEGVQSIYMLMWQFLYAEFLLFPLVR